MPSNMGKIQAARMKKDKKTAKRNVKEAADAAAVVDSAAAAAASDADAAAAAAASCAFASANAPAAAASSGSAAAVNRRSTCRSYAAVVAITPAIASFSIVNTAAGTTTVAAASVTAPSSDATKFSKKIKYLQLLLHPRLSWPIPQPLPFFLPLQIFPPPPGRVPRSVTMLLLLLLMALRYCRICSSQIKVFLPQCI
jgi:hypothetical protein